MPFKNAARKAVEELYPLGRNFFVSEGMRHYFDTKRNTYKYLCIYGAGVWGTTICRWLMEQGIKVDFFCDTYKAKAGSFRLGIPVISFDQLELLKEDTYVIVSVTNKGVGQKHNEEINRQLASFPHVMPNLLKMNGFYTNDYNLTMEECAAAAEKIMGALEDTRSRELFMEMLPYKFVKDAEPVKENTLEKYYNPVQYFSEKYYSNSNHAVIVDCGAFKGDTLQEFVRLHGAQFKGYHCFEMDGQAFGELEKNVGLLPEEMRGKVVLHKQGVFSGTRVAYYHALTDTLGSSVLMEEAGLRTQLVSLDDVLLEEPVTMINMDIEGSELPALKGAKRLIERWRPMLAVSIYHSTEQFFSVPAYIIERFPFYRFYLDLHTTITDDCVFYAVPR